MNRDALGAEKMKSAYELAMERLGGTVDYTESQKEAMAEIDRRYDAKDAEARLGADTRIKKSAGDPTKIEAAQQELVRDLARHQEKREAEKNAILNH